MSKSRYKLNWENKEIASVTIELPPESVNLINEKRTRIRRLRSVIAKRIWDKRKGIMA